MLGRSMDDPQLSSQIPTDHVEDEGCNGRFASSGDAQLEARPKPHVKGQGRCQSQSCDGDDWRAGELAKDARLGRFASRFDAARTSGATKIGAATATSTQTAAGAQRSRDSGMRRVAQTPAAGRKRRRELVQTIQSRVQRSAVHCSRTKGG